MRKASLAALLAMACVFAGAAPTSARKPIRVPYPFVGMNAGTLLLNPKVSSENEFRLMAQTGVQRVRELFVWSSAQPYQNVLEVPPDQLGRYQPADGADCPTPPANSSACIPTDWSQIDTMVAGAAARKIRILPVVQFAPPWAARHPGQPSSPPKDPMQFAHFLGSLVKRYGPNGTFWASNPDLPKMAIRDWQLWDEPIYKVWWSDQPFAADYVALLQDTRQVVRSLDSHARIVLAGDPPAQLTKQLEEIYAAGGRAYFDVAAAHPFTNSPGGVVYIAKLHRRVMNQAGDKHKPLVLTEVTWPSSKGQTDSHYGYEQTEQGQASKLVAAFKLLAMSRKALNIESIFWYAWLTPDRDAHYPFDYSGLRKLRDNGPVSKPAFKAFKKTALAFEGCKRKEVATACSK